MNALAEIRACYGDVRTYVTGVFERLDKLVEEVEAQKTPQAPTTQQAEQVTIQAQIDQLAQLATQLAQSAAEHKRMTSDRGNTERTEAKP